MMINKRLISMMGDSKRYIAWNVVLQFLALLANIVMIFAVSRLLAGLLDGTPDLPTALLYILGALIVRFFCTRGAASASYNASCTVKKTLRAAIYEKLLRLGRQLHPGRAHRGGFAAGRRGRRAARDLLRRVSCRSFSTP